MHGEVTDRDPSSSAIKPAARRALWRRRGGGYEKDLHDTPTSWSTAVIHQKNPAISKVGLVSARLPPLLKAESQSSPRCAARLQDSGRRSLNHKFFDSGWGRQGCLTKSTGSVIRLGTEGDRRAVPIFLELRP